jgi:ERCC4-type nuclease
MIIVDTREQLPLWDPINFKIVRKKLDEGDYTTEKLYNIAHIERKSPMDFYGSLIQGHKRFSREIQRAIEKDLSFAIFVECTEKKFTSMKFKGAFRLKTKPATLKKIVDTFQERYPIRIVWCKNREDMKVQMCLWFLQEEEVLIQNG